MPGGCLAEHLGSWAVLTAAERSALEGAELTRRVVRRGTVIRAEREPCTEMFVLLSGWLFCSTLLEDGRRQIIRFHFKGDLLGADMLGFRDAPDTITALTDAEICLIDPLAFGRLFETQPRLAALLYTRLQVERVTLADRLITLSRVSAKGRVAALLLWIGERLGASGCAHETSFKLPMTQEEIGDATGLTSVHVNRTLRALERQGVIRRARSMLEIVDYEALSALATRLNAVERVLPEWLPDRPEVQV